MGWFVGSGYSPQTHQLQKWSMENSKFTKTISPLISYWLYISAFDLGREPRTAFLNVTIDILDINDNAPSFNDPLLDCSNVRRSVEVQEVQYVHSFIYIQCVCVCEHVCM